MKKGITPTEMMAGIVLLVVGLLILIVIYATFTAETPNFVNIQFNRLLDWLLQLVS